MDLILRSVRSVDKFMGGVFIIAAGDHHQCGAVADLHPPLLTMCVRNNFDTLPMYTLFRYQCIRGLRGFRCASMHCDSHIACSSQTVPLPLDRILPALHCPSARVAMAHSCSALAHSCIAIAQSPLLLPNPALLLHNNGRMPFSQTCTNC